MATYDSAERLPGGAAPDYLDDPRPHAPAPGASVGGLRHTSSVILALVLTPIGLALVDLAGTRAYRSVQSFDDRFHLDQTLVLLVGGGILLLAAATGRLSGLGPLLAGVVWGVAPLAWMLVDLPSFLRTMTDLPEAWGNSGFWFVGSGFWLFPAAGALLIGTAVSGRWRRWRRS